MLDSQRLRCNIHVSAVPLEGAINPNFWLSADGLKRCSLRNLYAGRCQCTFWVLSKPGVSQEGGFASHLPILEPILKPAPLVTQFTLFLSRLPIPDILWDFPGTSRGISSNNNCVNNYKFSNRIGSQLIQLMQNQNRPIWLLRLEAACNRTLQIGQFNRQ